MANGLSLQQSVLSAAGAGSPLVVFNPAYLGNWSAGYLQPAILVFLSSGASMTYNIEVSGNDPTAGGYVEANAIWVPFTSFSGLTASATGTLGAAVKAIRANITAYTSGTLTFQFVQNVGS